MCKYNKGMVQFEEMGIETKEGSVAESVSRRMPKIIMCPL